MVIKWVVNNRTAFYFNFIIKYLGIDEREDSRQDNKGRVQAEVGGLGELY